MVSKSKESKGVNNQAKPGQLYNEYPVSDESNLLTRDDIARRKQNLPPQHYDAYLLFDEDDINFATQVLDKLETEYGLKVIKSLGFLCFFTINCYDDCDCVTLNTNLL